MRYHDSHNLSGFNLAQVVKISLLCTEMSRAYERHTKLLLMRRIVLCIETSKHDLFMTSSPLLATCLNV